MTETTHTSRITTNDILTVAKLSRLAVNENTASNYAQDISKILDMMDTLSAIDTDGVKPLANIHEASQPLRADVADSNINRELNQSNAPAKQEGLFLVPQVIE
ncbi:MAG: Asp-tRNA(Asn)/Glu-tRNA(Gln) amidotransferase GatCAB subunit C [Gammaproteobacteria bacterium]|nr:MAG: Asp-tRNA(Asn)/Glu-tRNA(Gln) amidotransferase GatCAB subunit C [Gammaproteobacteria bacterium]